MERNFLKKRKAVIFCICMIACFSLGATACAEGAAENLQSSNQMIADTSWVAVDDGSHMVFMDDENYAWYQTKGVVDDNYFAGTYQFYVGEAVLQHLTVDLADFGVTKDELQQILDQNAEYDLENFMCMTVANMTTGTYYGFTKEDGK